MSWARVEFKFRVNRGLSLPWALVSPDVELNLSEVSQVLEAKLQGPRPHSYTDLARITLFLITR